jgi:hypothetical protein
MLYKYIFRGIGLVFMAGMLTALFIAIYSQTRDSRRVPSHAVTQPPEKAKARR